MTQTVELLVRVTMTVDSAVAEAVASNMDCATLNLPLASVQLLLDGKETPAQVFEYETMLAEVLSE